MVNIPLQLAATALLGNLVNCYKLCHEYTIPVEVESEDFVLSIPPFQNNYDVADFVTNITRRGSATDFNPFAGSEKVTHAYNISATFCTPVDPRAKHRDTVILATHGLNFDRQYWLPSFAPEQYSFADYAIARGYSIFFYDRVGAGRSSIVSGFTNQLANQVAVSLNISQELRAGHYTGPIGVPKSLVLVGHSFGSSISSSTVAARPEICDALVLTGMQFAVARWRLSQGGRWLTAFSGYSFNTSGQNGLGFIQSAQLRIASTVAPAASDWDELDTGYLTPVDVYSNVNTFFKKPDYDPAVAEAAYSRRQPLAFSEFLTFASGNQAPVTFKGKAMVIAGQSDFIFCTGQCDGLIEHPAAEIFSNASSFRAVSYPHAGHALNFASNAAGAFREIFDFLET
ncbi:hypothetical protein LTR53_014994 [Teratosphaeriaceae sp. CCFEE 6253]|nr:hypothetical protein LTR53_014994 [Teratosphaeriaceae sp. CCFEE 6253]